jgi:hypothetical protein
VAKPPSYGLARDSRGRLSHIQEWEFGDLLKLFFRGSLERRNPTEAEFHVILNEAFEQEAKNASKARDLPAIEELRRKSLGEARTALSLDPRNELARIKVAGLQDKLVKSVIKRPSSR